MCPYKHLVMHKRHCLCADEMTAWDKLITQTGKLGFLEGFARFPVLYVDEDLTVFRFPPLGVNIAARRVQLDNTA